MALLCLEILFRFSLGWLLAQFFVVRQETTERFLKINYFIVLAVIGCALPLAWGLSPTLQSRALLGLILLAISASGYTFSKKWPIIILGLTGYLASSIIMAPIFQLSSAMLILSFLGSSLYLGFVFMAMTLGHWYLNVPGLHIKELKRVTHLSLLFCIIMFSLNIFELFVSIGWDPPLFSSTQKSVFDTSSTISNQNHFFQNAGLTGESYFGLGFFGLLILSARFLWGLIAPLIMIYLAAQTLKTRSTQSATGILYSVCVMLIIGEAIALYFKYQLGWSL